MYKKYIKVKNRKNTYRVANCKFNINYKRGFLGVINNNLNAIILGLMDECKIIN